MIDRARRATVRIPDVVGIPLIKAKLILASYGLEIGQVLFRQSYVDQNVVVEQRPARGHLAHQGDPVELWISKRSYIEFLPAIYHRPDLTGRNFVREFLWIPRHLFASIEEKLDHLDAYFDPLRCSEEYLMWLASWVGMVVDDEWSLAKKRALIRRAIELYRIRGTIKGLKLFLKTFTGHEPNLKENEWPFRGFRIGVFDDEVLEEELGLYLGAMGMLDTVGGGAAAGEGAGGGEGGAGASVRLRRPAEWVPGPRIGIDSIILPEVNKAHCFVVEMPVAFEDVSPETVMRIHEVIQAEKPAHGSYCLRFLVEKAKDELREFYTIGMRSGVAIGDEIIQEAQEEKVTVVVEPTAPSAN